MEPKQHPGPQQVVAPSHVTEPTSRSNFQKIATTHLSFDLNVDFHSKVVSGTVSFALLRRDEYVDELILDTRDLVIHECWCKTSGFDSFTPTEHSLSEPPHPIFGSALKIRLKKNATQVKVRFETTDKSSALQWLNPSQTAGKRHPYLFTQSQAIHARSFFPCQDAPGVKATYDAKITVPAPLVALMSAVSTGSSKNAEQATYHFRQQVPMPSYLVALAVGDLESRELGPRSRVWSEPSMVELAHYEFVDTEKFLSTAEQLAGDYVWGRYDLLVLPPSFPYGGMENPCLVFLTPTLLAGDRSLVNVVAHEIAHAWFGNLVTNATWEDFWMNEGFTVFAERRIIAKLFGENRAGLKAVLGKRHWKEDVDRYGANHPFTKLHVDMRGSDVDPDDSFSSVPYEKGCAFLEHIERLVGGPTRFEKFLKEYVQKFRFGFVDVASFREFVEAKFPDLRIDWDTWVYGTGIPPEDAPAVDNVLVALAERVADVWCATGTTPPEAAGASTSWSSDQLTVMLEKFVDIQASKALSETILRDVDACFGFSDSRNSEIRFKWNTLCLRMPNPTQSCYEDTVDFLGEQGRMKFVRPLYRDLFKANKQLALDTFAKNKDNYHSIAQKMIARDLAL
jgi:leukotriene-A4 hydrolase